ncbi:MAG: ribonuclease P protein component [Candidatus Doudnabacteria bacterium RIFCSPLOWO2_01_FULL_44_21]|uniref:Ribonuclease P protein component n=1 Tax=Candidatus Doudnabacteria bacterium RIFCSPLOWO2_01_FULL_44_21 TaxID=1817841 RepID=A0A1F5PX80_9BACT|nr:MAG: ribonuclease P protein component [Candidatus Doudnabacteria bacterium RIFCSPHIGHO2_02_FULL_43_13b]OGE94541.1 MAG: ribonuclease P protein component [Candidatus Doudnabacteria bacterium RIFCSPLOWO2_01_FULL_44_21]
MGKIHLLKNEADFTRFRSGRFFQSLNLRIRVLPSNQNLPRFGFIVPKKILPKAVDRNKVKRRLKSIVSQHQNKFKSFDVLFFPSSKILRIKFQDLELEVTQLLKRANVWQS